MNYLDLFIYVTTAAVVLAIIGIIAILADLYGDRLHSLWTRYMDRSDKTLGRRIEELDDKFCGTPSANELELEMKEVWHELTLNDEGRLDLKEEEFDMDFLSDKFKEGDKKVESGEISCNLDSPEDCENCGS